MTTTKIRGFDSQRLFQKAQKAVESRIMMEVESLGYTDPVSKRMIMLGRAASTYAENMVEQTFISMGYKTKNFGDSSQSDKDLQVKINGIWYSVEVKSARAHKSTESFNFQGINPAKFDILVCVYIAKDGIYMVMAHRNAIGPWLKRFSKWHRYEGTRQGFQLIMSKHRTNKNMRGNQVLFDLNKKNIRTMLSS